MLKIKIAKTEIEYLEALETEQFYNGASRRVLSVTCAPDAISMDKLNALLTETNLASVTMTNTDSGAVNVYDGYVLKLECGVQSKMVQAESPEAAAVYADRLIVKLGRRTYIEDQLHKLGLM